MNATANTRWPNFVVKGVGISLGLVFIGWLYIFAYDHIRVIKLDSIFDPAYGYSKGYREAYFRKSFPSSGDIENYLHDATLVISKPPRGNEVYYFDKSQKFILWRGPTLENGEWWLVPELQILKLGTERRFAIVQSFCMSLVEVTTYPQQDNCYSIAGIDSILPRGADSRRERINGNVFKLAFENPPPFPLPNSEVTVAILLQRISDSGH